MSEFLRAVEGRERIQTLVRHFRYSNMGFTWVGIGLVGKMRLGKNAEQRGLTYLGKANDAGFHKGQER